MAAPPPAACALRPLRGVPSPAVARLAAAIFGRGDRPPGWFARKLAREAVDPDLSLLALAPGAEEPVPEDMLLGYILVGREPGDPAAHSAGVGVVPGRRGGGIGRALVRAAVQGLAASGEFSALRVLAEPAREPFYARLGFTVRSRHVTLLAHGTCPIHPDPRGDGLAAQPPLPWSPDPIAGAVEVCAWRAGTWARTPRDAAATLELHPTAWAHVSREGTALLVHRLLVPPATDPLAATAALLARIPHGTPILLYGADPVSSITEGLASLGFCPVQRFAAMELPLPWLLDNFGGCGA